MSETENDKNPQDRNVGWAAFERAVDAAVKSGPKHKHKDDVKIREVESPKNPPVGDIR